MRELIIKRSKLKRGYMRDADGCGCFTGHLCKSHGFTEFELRGTLSPATLAVRFGSARGLSGLVYKTPGGFGNTSITDRLIVANDGRPSGIEREAELTAIAAEIGVLAVFVD